MILSVTLDPLALAVVVAAALGGLLFTWYLVRSNALKAAQVARDLWKAEAEAFQSKADRLATELKEEGQLRAKLEGRIDQLSKENADLRSLIMGEKVPPALERMVDLHIQKVLAQMDVLSGTGLTNIRDRIDGATAEILRAIEGRSGGESG